MDMSYSLNRTLLPTSYSQYTHSRQFKILTIDGLEFPNDLDEYLCYFMHMRSYEDLISKPGYKIPLDVAERLITVFWPTVKNQINFIRSCLPRALAVQITDVWSAVTMIRMAMTEINYGSGIKSRLQACCRLYENYNSLIEIQLEWLMPHRAKMSEFSSYGEYECKKEEELS